MLAPAAELDPAARARFAREAAALAALRHPGLVALLDHGIDDELGPYLVLPLLPGVTVRALAAGRALGPEAAVLIAQPIAAAVAALHAAGYVHRDVKPDNVMAGPDGALTLIDLGLAWREGMPRLTETGVAVGSVGYMSPEQLEGRAVGAATDVWAVGAMLYELCGGQRPFARGRAGEEAAATLLGSFPPLPSLDRRAGDDLAALVARCLDATPAARPTAAALADALAELARSLGVAGRTAEAVADPLAFARAVAPERARACEAAARAALRDGQPFVALAACDRGLAYAPGDPALEGVIADCERLTGGHRAPPGVATAVALPRRRRLGWWIGGAIGALLIAGIALGRSAPGRDPAEVEREQGLAIMGGMIDVFGKVVDESIAQRKTAAAECARLRRADDPAAPAACAAACKLGDQASCPAPR